MGIRQRLIVSCCLWALLAASGAAAQTIAPPVIAEGSRFVRQLNKLENFVDSGVASSNSTKTRRQSPRVVDDTPRVPFSYLFFATFRNRSDKTVKALEWDYVLTDNKDPQHEMLRVTVRNEAKIAAGQKKSLESRERGGLDRVWNARKKGTAGVVITRVEYADGSVWEAGKIIQAEK